ncbi:MAG: 4Fe-4S binding protein [Thermoanaerobacteraceae bacterium]|nr:4Fe-4S binding protein [Thermoanaerobacteraceae bacterium]
MIDINEAKCTGCALCSYVCPHGVIAVENGKARLANVERCIECGACQLNCDQGAIFVTKGTGCLVSIIKEDILKIKEKGCG